MKLLLVGLMAFIGTIFFAVPARAGTSQLLITEVRLGGSEVMSGGIGYKQYVVLHNNGEVNVDLSNWRLQYAKADFAGACDSVEWSTEVALSGAMPPKGSSIFSYQLTDKAAGSLRVVDGSSTTHDMVGWGAAPCSEVQPMGEVPVNDSSIVRYANCNATYSGADTDNNANDFSISSQAFAVVKAPECQPTCASNQQLIDGVCVNDQCENLEGFQGTVPDGYEKTEVGCQLALLPLSVTEILPNVAGSDSGKEFIELYNPHNQPIELKWYALKVGSDIYPLPDETIGTGEYKVFSDAILGGSLPNTSAAVTLQSIDGQVLQEVPTYVSPKDDMAWADINDTWQFTNRPTPAAANLPSFSDEKGNGSAGEDEPRPCAANQYRNSETNRCRLKVTTEEGELAPCKDGQYRSEETNRCRNATTASTLTPCKEGQYRSEETNRCRSVASDTNELTPCKEGQERNPDTNRCRNVQSAQLAAADYAVEPVKETATAFTGWWALGGIGALAAGKIGWEWREEILTAVRKAGSFFTSGK